MKASRDDARRTRITLISLYRHADVRAILDTLAVDTMCAFFRGLTKLGTTYIGLKELDLSNGLAVMACEDYGNMWRDGYQVHPQGHAALTQQALPIGAADLFKHLFPSAKPLLPELTLLHLKLVKVIISAQLVSLHICHLHCTWLRLDTHICCCGKGSFLSNQGSDTPTADSGGTRQYQAHCEFNQ